MGFDAAIEDLLNKQIGMEAFASQFYLALAYWCDEHALTGCKAFFIRQYEEERMHMMKIYEYMSESGHHPVTPALDQPGIDYSTVKEVFTAVLGHEQRVTHAIHNIAKACYTTSDFATLQFMQWYIEEQREEEALIQDILDRIEIIGDGAQSLYYIDKEIRLINDRAEKEDSQNA